MSGRDELAAVLGKHTGECLRFGKTCKEVRPRDQWCGRCDMSETLADAVQGWLGEQFDAGLREAADLAVQDYETGFSQLDDTAVSGYTETVLAVVRARLGLDAPAQAAQDGPPGSGSNEVGSGCTGREIGRQIGDNEEGA